MFKTAEELEDILVSMEGVSIRYPNATLFTDVSIEVKKGESLALIGENERFITGILEALAGKVHVTNGRSYFGHSSCVTLGRDIYQPKRLTAYVSSKHNFKNLSNTSDFYYQQRFNSTDSENSATVKEYLLKLEDKLSYWNLDRVVKWLNLYQLLDEQLIKLSNGETKRVLLAAALLLNPALLILNNPLTGLDVQARKKIIALLDEVHSLGITVVMSTSRDEIPAHLNKVGLIEDCNKIAWLDKEKLKGRKLIIQDGNIDEADLKALLPKDELPVFDFIVRMKDVTIKYDDKTILDKVNWTIKQGERWALVGPNGAGKSTLLSLINGDNPQAFANDIILFDRKKGSGESIWDIKKKIGFFSSELYQYFLGDTSCLHAVESGFYDTIGLFRPGHSQKAAIALQWMQLLGVRNHAGKLLKSVSLVEQRLCLLARALVKNPVLLILDEPCQGFNQYQQFRFKKLIDVICSLTNVTLIYVTHYEEEIPESVTKVLQLSKGRVVEEAAFLPLKAGG